MTWASYETVAELTDPYMEMEYDEFLEAMDDINASVERVGDNVRITYPSGGNVTAVQHAQSLLRDLDDLGVEATSLKLTAQQIKVETAA